MRPGDPPPPFCSLSENITATAVYVLGVDHGGKMATGMRPSGVKDSAAKAVEPIGFIGEPPPKKVPGWGRFGGARPCCSRGVCGCMTKEAMPTPAAAAAATVMIPTLMSSSRLFCGTNTAKPFMLHLTY